MSALPEPPPEAAAEEPAEAALDGAVDAPDDEHAASAIAATARKPANRVAER
jgi:hypothetical protein